MQYNFQPSRTTNLYQRNVLTVIDVLSLVGGLYASIASGGAIFTSLFNYKLYVSSLVQKLFYFKPRNGLGEEEKPKTRKNKNIRVVLKR